jgi:hypothetical protein
MAPNQIDLLLDYLNWNKSLHVFSGFGTPIAPSRYVIVFVSRTIENKVWKKYEEIVCSIINQSPSSLSNESPFSLTLFLP